jgi:hypothetical protein
MWIMTKTGNIVAVRPTVIFARVYGERWGMWTRGIRRALVVDENEHALLFRGARAGAGVALDHSLRRQEILDLLTEHRDIIVFLEPVGAFLAKAKALKTQTDACLAPTLRVWPFITFLAADSASIAARLGAYRAFCLGRSGLLSLLLLWWCRCDGSPRGGGRIMHSSGRE